MVRRTINLPPVKKVTRKSGASPGLQDAVIHSIISLDSLTPLRAGMCDKLKIDDAGPLFIAVELLALPRFLIQTFGFFDSAQREIRKASIFSVKSSDMPT